MDKSLCDKIDSLPLHYVCNYYLRLSEILNNRKSSFDYGGMNDEDYSNFSVNKLAHEKLEIIEQKVYEEMFEGKVFLPA